MTNNKIQAYAERLDRLEDEKKAISGGVKDIYSEVKSAGFNPQALRKVLAERRKKANKQLEDDMDAYKVALGMALVRDEGLSLREAEKISGASKSSIHRALNVPEVSHSEESGDRQSPVRDGEASAEVTTASASSSPPIDAEMAAEAERLGLTAIVRDLAAKHDAPDLTIPEFLDRRVQT